MVGTSLDAPKLYPPPRSTSTIKFLCSYGGRILPRYPDRKLRYYGGETRVLAVIRSISFSELILKMGELCGMAVSLRCQLPMEDLDALVSITSDEDLANLIEEYDRAASSCPKIRAFLLPPKSTKKISPPPSLAYSSGLSSTQSSSPSSSSSSSSSYHTAIGIPPRFPKPVMPRPVFPLCVEKSVGKNKMPQLYGYGNPGHIHLVHNGNHWQ